MGGDEAYMGGDLRVNFPTVFRDVFFFKWPFEEPILLKKANYLSIIQIVGRLLKQNNLKNWVFCSKKKGYPRKFSKIWLNWFLPQIDGGVHHWWWGGMVNFRHETLDLTEVYFIAHILWQFWKYFWKHWYSCADEFQILFMVLYYYTSFTLICFLPRVLPRVFFGSL